MRSDPPKRIPLIRLVPQAVEPEGQKALGFKYAGGDVGNRHQLGGEPTWLQEPDWPTCPYCGEKMTFYGQLDSIGDDYEIADCGMVYVFLCFDCFKAVAKVQSH